MATKTVMKRGDSAPPLVITCSDGDAPVDLTSAASIRVLGQQNKVLIIDRDVTDSADDQGHVTLDWEAGDTAVAKDITLEVEITWGDGTVQTFPPSNYITVQVNPDLG